MTTIAFITGGNRGIGLETAKQLGKQGIFVVIGSRDEVKGKTAADSLKKDGIDVDSIKFDVGNSADYKAAYDYFDQKFGKLDILINNAGVAAAEGSDISNPEDHAASTVSQEILHTVFETNFFDVIALTQTLLPLIKKSPAGRIVNLSSILGSNTLHADPTSPIYDFKSLAYNASKSALNSFTIALAYDLRDTKIKVNSAHPGWVKTDMGGPNAMMEIEDGAKTSVQLATLPDDGPTGAFIHLGQPLPW
jgi:NAD(P)-dependent dehydrogenase (short-subunit alcohol dehydrogenase family)